MRKTLLATTALVAAGLLATNVAYAEEHEAMGEDEMMAEDEMMEEAMEGEMMEEAMMAEEPVSVGLGGSARVVVGASSHDSSPNMHEYIEPVISGSATMDNGLTFGVSMVIDASTGPMAAYDRTLTVGGAFGDIIVGQTHGARGKMRISSAGGTSSFGVQGPYYAGIAGSVFGAGAGSDGSGAGMGGRLDRIIYMSPALGGIQVGLSYAPDNDDADDQIAAAATYTQGLGDASVSVNVGYETGDAGDGRSPSDLNAGASISVGDITLSGGMRSSDTGHAMGVGESTLIDIGASMAMGALTVSAGWASHDRASNDMTEGVLNRDTNMYALGASYPLGEGVQLDVQLDFGDIDSDDDATTDDEWVQFMIGTAINF